MIGRQSADKLGNDTKNYNNDNYDGQHTNTSRCALACVRINLPHFDPSPDGQLVCRTARCAPTDMLPATSDRKHLDPASPKQTTQRLQAAEA